LHARRRWLGDSSRVTGSSGQWFSRRAYISPAQSHNRII
jgi:hypothetical protein